jgi:uncharacterized protein YndB with AHSA1/START domain
MYDNKVLSLVLMAVLLICGRNLLADQSGVPMGGASVGYGHIETDERGIAMIRYEREFQHPAQAVWDATTDPDSTLKFFSSADLQVGGQVSIRFSDELIELATITQLDAPVLLEYVNVETNGHPEKYYTDRLELKDHGDTCTVAFTTVIGPPGPLQLRIAAGWHIWIDNWQLQLDDRELTRAQLDATQPEREKQILEPYIQQLVALYPGWKAE